MKEDMLSDKPTDHEEGTRSEVYTERADDTDGAEDSDSLLTERLPHEAVSVIVLNQFSRFKSIESLHCDCVI